MLHYSTSSRLDADQATRIVSAMLTGLYYADSCDFVPSGLPGVITVAAADVTHDATKAFPWSWSNFGQCVEIWAPGVEIESASPDCFECTAVYSGTSQATPLVSGLVAAHLSANPNDDPEAVKKALQSNAAVNVLEVLGHPYDTTPNFFAQVSLDNRCQLTSGNHRVLPSLWLSAVVKYDKGLMNIPCNL
jgi:subtilisin family serine protease